MTGGDEHMRGTLELLVLSTLRDGGLHGYAIARSIEARSDQVFEIGQGSLYPALYRLERDGKVVAEPGVSETGRKVKVFSLTDAGRRALAREERGWERFTAAVARVVEGAR